MSAPAVALLLLIGWLVGLQAVWVGRDGRARLSRAVRVTTAVLCGGAALLAVPRFDSRGLVPDHGPDLTALALVAFSGWLVGLQALRVGHGSRAPRSRAVRVTTFVLGAGAVLLALPDLHQMLT